MKKLGRNTFAVGMATLLVTSAVSLSANAAEQFETAAEARFLAGTQGLGTVADQISRAIEGEEAVCDVAALTAGDCPILAENSDISIPVGEIPGLTLGAVDNFALASDDGTSRASSGVVGDNGFIDTDYDGPDGSVTLDIENGLLTEALSEAVADIDVTLGAVSAQADYDANTDDVTRDYNIASADVELALPVLTEINEQLGSALDDYNLLGTLAGTNALNTAALGELFPTQLAPLLEALGPIGAILQVQANFPSLDDVTREIGTFSDGGVTISLGSPTPTATVDLVAVLESQGLNINELPPETDLLRFLLPAIADALDSAIEDLFDTIVDEIVDNSSVTVSLLGGVLPVPPVTLDANQLDTLLNPLREGLVEALGTLDTSALQPLLSALLADDALAQVAQIRVNNPDLWDQDLVEGEEPMEGDVFSQTALRILLGGGTAADIQLANAVVGPANAVDLDDDDAVAGDDTDGAAGDDTDGAIADSDTDGVDGGVGDGGGQGDADVVTSLPNAGAPNLLPFWLLGAGLIAFGGAVLLNERRRTALI